MDPDEALRQLQAFFADLQERIDDMPDEDDQGKIEFDPYELTEIVDVWNGLNQWMSQKGFLPKEWRR